jgi:hypothetical protein
MARCSQASLDIMTHFVQMSSSCQSSSWTIARSSPKAAAQLSTCFNHYLTKKFSKRSFAAESTADYTLKPKDTRNDANLSPSLFDGRTTVVSSPEIQGSKQPVLCHVRFANCRHVRNFSILNVLDTRPILKSN